VRSGRTHTPMEAHTFRVFRGVPRLPRSSDYYNWRKRNAPRGANIWGDSHHTADALWRGLRYQAQAIGVH
jgi:hypothetical protein